MDDLDKQFDEALSEGGGDFESNFSRLNNAFATQFGRPFHVSGGSEGLHGIHRRLYNGQARDVRSRDLSPQERKFLVDQGPDHGLDVRDYTDTWKTIKGSGSHIHINQTGARSRASSSPARVSGSSLDQFFDDALKLGQSPEALASPDTAATATPDEPADFSGPHIPMDETPFADLLKAATRPRRALQEPGQVPPQVGETPEALPTAPQTPRRAAPVTHPVQIRVGDLAATGALTRDSVGDRLLESLGYQKDERQALKKLYKKQNKPLPWLPSEEQVTQISGTGGDVAQLELDPKAVGQLRGTLKKIRALKGVVSGDSAARVQALQQGSDSLTQELQSLAANRQKLIAAGTSGDELAPIDRAIFQRAHERYLLQQEIDSHKKGTATSVEEVQSQLTQLEGSREKHLRAGATATGDRQQELYSIANREHARVQMLRHYLEQEASGHIGNPLLRELASRPVKPEHIPTTWEQISGGVGAGAASVFAGMDELGANLFNSDALRNRAQEFHKLGAISAEGAGPGLVPEMAKAVAAAGLTYPMFRGVAALGSVIGPGVGIGEAGGEATALGLYGAAEHAHEGPTVALKAALQNALLIPVMRGAARAGLPTRVSIGFGAGFVPTYLESGDLSAATAQGLVFAGMSSHGQKDRRASWSVEERMVDDLMKRGRALTPESAIPADPREPSPRFQQPPEGGPVSDSQTTIPETLRGEATPQEQRSEVSGQSPTEEQPAEAAQVTRRRVIVHSDDGRVGVIQIGKEGRAEFNEVTNPKSLRKYPEPDHTLPPDEFDGLFPKNPDGYMPGSIEAERRLFVRDEKLLEPGVEGTTVEPAKSSLPEQPGSPATVDEVISAELDKPRAKEKAPAPVEPGEQDPAAHLEKFDSALQQEYQTAVEHVQRTRFATETLLARKMDIPRERAGELLNRMEDDGVILRDQNGRRFVPKPAKEVVAPPVEKAPTITPPEVTSDAATVETGESAETPKPITPKERFLEAARQKSEQRKARREAAVAKLRGAASTTEPVTEREHLADESLKKRVAQAEEDGLVALGPEDFPNRKPVAPSPPELIARGEETHRKVVESAMKPKREELAARIKKRLGTQEGIVREKRKGYSAVRYDRRVNKPDANRRASRVAGAIVRDLEETPGNVSSERLQRRSAPRSSGSGARVHAIGITEPLKREGRLNFRGMSARHADDVAQLAQFERDPRTETFRIFYTKGGQIVAHEAVSSRLPDASASFVIDKHSMRLLKDLAAELERASPSEQPEIKQRMVNVQRKALARDGLKMRARMHRLEADGYFVVHNHPSGEPTPSLEDLLTTLSLGEVVPGFRGHVIVNSGKYGFIDPGGRVTMHEMTVPPERLLVPSMPHPALGEVPVDQHELARIAKSLQTTGWVPILYLDAGSAVRAIEEIPAKLFNGEGAADFIRGRKRDFGSPLAIAYSGESRDVGAGMKLVREGILHDHVHPAVTAREMGTEAKPNPLYGQQGRRVGEAAGEPSLDQLPPDLRDDLVELARTYIDEGKTDFNDLMDSYEKLLGDHFDKVEPYLPEIFDRASANPASGAVDRIPLAVGKPEEHAATVGKESRAVTPRGMEVQTKFAVFPADELVTSHNTELKPNPHFPEGVQNRDRAKVSSEDDMLEKIKRFEPEYLGESIEAGKGAPIVGPDMAVESGNGRTILLRRIYRDHPEQAQKYHNFMISKAKELGLDPAAIEATENPILARIRTTDLTPQERIQFAEQANEETQLKLSPVEVARGDARKLNSQAMSQFAPGEEGELVTAANRGFIQHFLDQIVGPNRGDVLTEDGRLNQTGIARIRNAIFARAYGDTDAGIQALEKLSESPDNNIKRVTNSLVYNAGRFAALKDQILSGSRFPVDISRDLAEAAKQLSLVREHGGNVEDYLRQRGLFGDDLSRLQKKALYVFNEFKSSARAINGILDRYFAGVEALGDPRQASFFAKSPPTKEELFEAALEEAIHGKDEQGGLFSQPPTTTLGGADKEILFQSEPDVAGGSDTETAARDQTAKPNPQSQPGGRRPAQGEGAAPNNVTTPSPPVEATSETPTKPKARPQAASTKAPKRAPVQEPQPATAAGRPEPRGPDSDSSLGEGADRLLVARQEHTRAADLSRIPESLKKHLAPHQQEGVAHAIAAMDETSDLKPGGFLLADGTGAGKTRQILAVASNYASQGHPVVIIAPGEVLKPNWKKGEAAGSYAKDSRAMGISYDLKRMGPIEPGKIRLTTYENIGTINLPKDAVVIFDEAHYLKNADSNRSQAGRKLIEQAHSVLYATATPADKPTHLEYLARAGILEGQTVEKAFEDLGLVQRRVKDKTKGGYKYIWEVDPSRGTEAVLENIDALFDRLTKRGLMIKREISMEGVDIEFKQITLPPEARATMDRISAGFGGLENASGLLKARILMHQRRQQEPYKIDHVVAMAKNEIGEGRQAVIFMGRINESEAGMDVYDKNGEIIGRRTFAQSEGTAKSLRAALEKAGITAITELHGNADLNAEQAMAEFQSGKAVAMIATTESGGTGINLDDIAGDRPRTLIMMTAPFSAMTNVQASGRVWRMTTKSFPRLKYIFSDLDIDKWNAGIIAAKMRSLKATVRGEVERMAVNPDELAAPVADSGEGLRSPESYGLTSDDYNRVISLKKSLDKRGELVGDYLRQQSLFGEELSGEQKQLLGDLATKPAKKAAARSEQPTLFDEGGMGAPESYGRKSLTKKSIERARSLNAEDGEEVPDFKVSQRALEILKEIGVPGAEKYLSKRLAGVYKLRSKNVRVQSLFDVFVVAHEGTHAISHNEGLIDSLIEATSGRAPFESDQVRKDLTGIYEEYYPGGSRSHPLKLRMEEGFATLVENYLYDPAAITAKYPRLVEQFLRPDGDYYHPATSRLLDRMNSLVDDYSKMKPWQRVGARVVSGPEVTKVDKGFDVAQRLIYESVNQFEPLKRAGQTAGVAGTLDDPFIHAYTQMGRGSIIHSWIKGKNTLVLDQEGNWTQEPGTVKDYLKLIKGNEKEFDTLLVSRRVVEDHNRLVDLQNQMAQIEGDPDMAVVYEELKAKALQIARVLKNDDFNLQDANATVEKYGPQFKEALKLYDGINKRLVDFAENTGLVTPEFAQEMRSRKGYASWIRKINDELRQSAGAVVGGKSSQTKARSFKARGGATLDIISPTYNQVTAIGEIIGKGLDNMIWQRVYELSLEHPEIGRRFEKMETQTAVGQNGEVIYPQDSNPNLLKVWLGGKRVYVKPAPEFAAVAKNLRGKEWDLFATLIRMPSAVFTRLTTSANPFFALGNITIDQFSASMNSKTGFKPLLDPLHSFAEFVREVRVTKEGIGLSGTGQFEKYLELGGKRQVFASQYEVAPEQTIASILGRKSKAQRVGHVLDLGLSALELPSNLSEYVTRFAEFNRAKEMGKSDVEAMAMSSEVTTPFQLRGHMGGSFGQVWRDSLPYFNAGLQVLYKFGRATHDNPARVATVASGLMAAALTSAIATFKSADEEQKRELANLPARELGKAIFIPSPLGKSLIRIKIPGEVGALTGLAYLYVAQHYNENKVKFDDVLDSLSAALPNQLDVLQPEKLAIALLPQAVSPTVQALTNKKIYPELLPIVPDSIKDKPVEMQYTAYTSKVGKAIGAALGVAPAKVDFWVKNQLGAVGGMLLGKFPQNPLGRGEEGFQMAGRAYNNFYSQRQFLDQQFQRLSAPDNSFSPEEQERIIRTRALYDDVAGTLTKMRKVLVAKGDLPESIKQQAFETLVAIDRNDPVETLSPMVDKLDTETAALAEPGGVGSGRRQLVSERINAMTATDTYKALSKDEKREALKDVISEARSEASASTKNDRDPKPVDVATFNSELNIEKSRLLFEMARDPNYSKLRPHQKEYARAELAKEIARLRVKSPDEVDGAREALGDLRGEMRGMIKDLVESAREVEKVSAEK